MESGGKKGFLCCFLCQKMQNLDLYGTRGYCSVYMLDSLNHIVSEKELEKALRKVSLFMNPGALFVFDVNTPYKHREVLANQTFVYDTEEVFCVWAEYLGRKKRCGKDLSGLFPSGWSGIYPKQ